MRFLLIILLCSSLHFISFHCKAQEEQNQEKENKGYYDEIGVGLNFSKFFLLFSEPSIYPLEVNSQYRFTKIINVDLTGGVEFQKDNEAMKNASMDYSSYYGKIGVELSNREGPLYVRLSYSSIWVNEKGYFHFESPYWSEDSYKESYADKHHFNSVELGFGGKLLFPQSHLTLLAGFRLNRLLNPDEIKDMNPNASRNLYYIPSVGLFSAKKEHNVALGWGMQISLLYLIK